MDEEIVYNIHDAFINQDFDYLYDVIDYYNEHYDEDVIFHMLELTMDQITNEYETDEYIDKFDKMLNYLLNNININRVSTSGLTPAYVMIIIILRNIKGRWGDDPENYFQFIDKFFDNYVDMSAGSPSINNLLTIEPDDEYNIVWCKTEIKRMIDYKKSEVMKKDQTSSFISELGQDSGHDSAFKHLDLDTMSKIYGYIKTPNPDVYDKSMMEYEMDPLVKSEQRLAFAKGLEDPDSNIKIDEEDLIQDIGEHISSHRPYPYVQKRYLQQTKPKNKKARKFAKRTIKNRRRRNRY